MAGQTLRVFLFTDVVGSTRLWAEHEAAMGVDLAVHDALVRDAARTNQGIEFSTAGDSFALAFESAADACRAAAAIQRSIADAAWQVPGGVAIRIGMHAGTAEVRSDNFYGQCLNEAARIMAAAHAGQIVVSDRVVALAPDSASFRELGVHRLRDLDGTWSLHQLEVEGLPGDHPPLRSQHSDRSTLPPRRTALIGRDQLLGDIRRQLAEYRLVTLMGPGGAGKTHAATEAAGRATEEFPGGTYFVDLTRARTDADVPAAFVDGLGTAAATDTDPRSHLAERLGVGRALLVVDNCEHVIDAAAEFIDHLLFRCPELRVLATTRISLDIDGERLVLIPPLDGAGPGSPGVRLFVERSLSADPAFDPDAPAVAAICEIVQRLDGMPLAIELAAARTRSMSVAEIRERLDDRFALLTRSRRRGRDRRQQTLEAAIDWSYDLLDDEHQRYLRTLAVAAGAVTRDTVAHLLGLSEVAADDAMDVLTSQSLVATVDVGALRGFRLLETIREYGRTKLGAAGELDDAELALEAALVADFRSHPENRMTRFGSFVDWTDVEALEAETRRDAAARALRAGRLEPAAMLVCTATSPEVPGALEALRSDAAVLIRRIDELSDEGRTIAALACACLEMFTGRGLSARRIADRYGSELPVGDPLRPPLLAWSAFTQAAMEPTDVLEETTGAWLDEARLHAPGPPYFSVSALLDVRAGRAFLRGRVDDAVEQAVEACEYAYDSSPNAVQGLSLLLFIAYRTGRELPPAIWSMIADLEDRDVHMEILLRIWRVVASGDPVEPRGRALLALTRQRPIGRYIQEESMFLVAFAHLALEAGDEDRARHLLDAAQFNDTTTLAACYDAWSRIDGWSDDDWEQRFADRAGRVFGAHDPATLIRLSRQRLAEELGRWEQPADPITPDSTGSRGVEISVLGALEVHRDGVPLEITAPKQRAIVAALAIASPRAASVDALVDAVWGDDPPETAARSLQSQISRLRKALGADVLVGNPNDGYRLVLPPESIDLHGFEAGIQNSAVLDAAARAEALGTVLDLWRGAPLPDLSGGASSGVVARLTERRDAAAEALAASLLEAGRPGDALVRAEQLVEEAPLREQRWVVLIDALVAAGRTAEALRAYQRARSVLADEAGVEPGDALREAEARALRATG